MNKLRLQSYADGNIYKHPNGTYSVETPAATGEGKTVAEALAAYSEKVAALEVTEPKEENTKKIK